MNVLPSGLWVVATPIGNLADLSDRARIALKSADAILCEDTRRTQALMTSLGLTNRYERLDAHSDERTLNKYVEHLKAGKNLALVSDAGTPGISDPGGRMVALARSEGITVVPIAGPSAVVAALSVAGLEISRFAFFGFLPRKEKEQVASIESAMRFMNQAELEPGRAAVALWFESPERIQESLDIIKLNLDKKLGLFLAKELTKVFERVWVGSVEQVITEWSDLDAAIKSKGEWVVGLYQVGEKISKQNKVENETALMPSLTALQAAQKTAEILTNLGIGTSVAAKQISQHFGVEKNKIYSFIIENLQNENEKNRKKSGSRD